MYNLTFYEAIERCANGEGFIRGDRFKDGVYVRKQGDFLIAVDAFNSNKSIGNFFITKTIMEQKYKLFETVVQEELKDNNSRMAFACTKAP